MMSYKARILRVLSDGRPRTSETIKKSDKFLNRMCSIKCIGQLCLHDRRIEKYGLTDIYYPASDHNYITLWRLTHPQEDDDRAV